MDDSSPDPGTGPFTEITVRIPDELARLIGTDGEVERRVLEALALDEFRQGHLSQVELGRLLGFDTQARLDAFLAAHEVPHTSDASELDDASRARGRQAAANIIARRKGVTLGGLSIKDLINEGRP
jgi:Uncharacterised protein family (UPF0175)